MYSTLLTPVQAAVLVVLWAVGGIEQTPHSFTYSADQAHAGCILCHPPHQPAATPGLWQAPSKRVVAFPLFKAADGFPAESTLMCLTCRDGAIAAQTHLGNRTVMVSQVGTSSSLANARIGFPLGSHPVGVPYDPHDPKLQPPGTVTADGRIRLPAGRVECVSCHDPHGTAGHPALLVKSDRRSGLCLSCHRL